MSGHADHVLLSALGAKIRSLREARGLTQQALAEMIGLGQFTFSRYEGGRRSAPVSVLGRIAEALGVPLATLFEGEALEPAAPAGREEWVWIWDQLDDRGREIVLAAARTALRRSGE